MPPRIAIVADRSDAVLAHARIPRALRASALRADGPIEPYWIGTAEVAAHGDLAGFDGVWLAPGSPYRDLAGALGAVRRAREQRIPFLGTCGGFQHALLELARDVAGLPDADHAESSPHAPTRLIVPLACSLAGGEGRVTTTPGSRAAAAMGGARRERYHCSFGLDERFLPPLVAGGLRVTGRDDDGATRIVELDGHPFFVATLFQPELVSDERDAHPLIAAFAAAVRTRAASRVH